MCEAIDRIERRGIEKGIISLVEAMRELGQSNEVILQMVMKKFSLTEEKARLQFRRQSADIRIATGGFIFQVAFGEMKPLWLALLVLFTPISGVIGVRLKCNKARTYM